MEAIISYLCKVATFTPTCTHSKHTPTNKYTHTEHTGKIVMLDHCIAVHV